MPSILTPRPTSAAPWRADRRWPAAARLFVLSLVTVALFGCTGMGSYETHHAWIKIRYSTGGAAPVVTELAISNQGDLDLVTTDWRTLSRPVADRQLARLRRLLNSQAMAAELRTAQPAGALRSASEESVLLSVGKRQYLFPAAPLPPTVRAFLEAVDDLFSRTHGNRYSLRIPH